MMLAAVILILIAGAFAAFAAGPWSRRVSLAALILELVLFAGFLAIGPHTAELSLPWAPALGSRVHLFGDGTSFALILLTLVLGIAAVAGDSIQERPGFYHFNLLLVLAGVVGVFTAVDLILFYFFWELMLIPMYFLIAIWGHGDRARAATKFFVFTQAGSLLLLLSILALAFFHHRATGRLTFEASELAVAPLSAAAEKLLFLGFFLGFAVKLPAVPIHTWLPDAHTEAPTGGSVILAGLLLKTGAFGLLRFAIPLFPRASETFARAAMIIGVAGILYGAFLAFAQSDLKRLIAYTSISHLGFVLLGAFTFTDAGRDGAVLQMICHGLSAAGLFLLSGAIETRLHTRDLRYLGGLMPVAPRMSAAALLLALASLGLPGMGNFVAELSILAAALAVDPILAIAAAIGLILATLYFVRLYQNTFHGELVAARPMADLGRRELILFGSLIGLLIAIGLHPQPLIDLLRGSSLQLVAGGR